MTKAELISFAEKKDIDLDDLVHDAKSEEASAINNCGTTEQVEYLISAYGLDGVKKLFDVTNFFEDKDHDS